VANYAEQAYLARPVMDMSTKVSSTSIPPLATMLDTLYNGRSVQHTWGGVLLVMNPESMAKLLGLLGYYGCRKLLPFSVPFDIPIIYLIKSMIFS